MGKNLTGKTVSIFIVIAIFTYGIFFGTNLPHKGSLKSILTDNIHLGLDLKGGTHLVLAVHVEEAIGSTTDRDVARLEADMQGQQMPGTVAKLDSAHPEVITVKGVPPAKSSDFRSLVGGQTYTDYAVAPQTDGSYKLTMTQRAMEDLKTRTLDTSIETIRERIDKLGVSEPVIAKYGLGDNQIVVELPGVDDPARVEDIIQSTAKLAIHAVLPNGPWASDAEAMTGLQGVVPPDAMLVHGTGSAGAPDMVYELKRASEVEGTDFRDAQPSQDINGRPNISFTLTTEAGDRFFKYTDAHKQGSADPGAMAIVLDNKVREVASIQSGIRDRGEITGAFTRQQADDLSLMLRTGALPASISYIETRTVGPSLGAASIRQGVVAAVAGMLAVMVFMLIYYRGSGINADLALLLNLLILLGFMGFSHATLTLPGIAGVILTIGMGVDSNVLIFERIREELRAGKTAAAAVKEGFDHAWITIVDTHVTTIVSAAILFLFGTGPVKGFAVTLTFGLLANLFTAVYVSRLIFDSHLRNKERGAALSI
ncbi:preprotein translocase subunit SecD [Granulicella rosea]|uniref:Protein translocase subunit SecD n=1 Tax=Granulicella rosea TaxID=474952 RepID=A0A239DA50_9BACT|nr:protein translocase subunit SecD [Granulicella rosea]SNS29180.1 preprotein translocase subunit SecD [Granulicella rosea]